MEKEFYQNNRKNYLNCVNDGSLSVFFSGKQITKSADQCYPFQVNNNFYYLTGINKPEMILVLAKGANQTRDYLFIEKPSEYASLWFGDKMLKSEASQISGIAETNIFYLEDFESTIHRLLQVSRASVFGFINDMYFDLEREGFEAMPSLGNQFANKIKDKYPHIRINNAYNIVCVLRTYKADCEVAAICDAIDITEEGIKALMVNAAPNMYENELESYYDQVIKYHGSRVSFTTIAASGVNGTVLHYDENNQVMKDNSLVLFDLGCISQLYCSDITRTFPVNGKFTDRQKEIYSIVLECNKKCIEWLRPGVTSKEYNDYARQILIDGCKRIGLIKEDQEINKYYYHSIGHYLGLDVHDVGEYVTPFKEGIVITCEPGLYIREEGIGIRIEDDVLITKDGAKCLSSNIIKEIDDIEDFMAKYSK